MKQTINKEEVASDKTSSLSSYIEDKEIENQYNRTLNSPWPLIEVLEKLIEGNKILLHDKSYDGHGWEFLNKAVEEGEKIIEDIKSNKSKQRIDTR